MDLSLPVHELHVCIHKGSCTFLVSCSDCTLWDPHYYYSNITGYKDFMYKCNGHVIHGHITTDSVYGLSIYMDYYYSSLHLFVLCSGWPAVLGGWNSPVHIHLVQLPSSPIYWFGKLSS